MPQTNAAIVRERAERRQGTAPRDVVLLNAGAALFIAGQADTVRDRRRQAAAAIDSGAAGRVLEQAWSSVSTGATQRDRSRRPTCSRRSSPPHAPASMPRP